MFAFLSEFLQKKQINCVSPIPLSATHVQKPYLLEREGITDGTVFVMTVPYFSHAAAHPDRNVSAYAVSRDYHLFFKELFDELLPILHARFPMHRFAAFADHSPIDERHAAASAGLGMLGCNGLLITPLYASYVFLAEIFTDATLPCQVQEPVACEGCGACLRACPMKNGVCLSALTQRKGDLTPDEQKTLLSHTTVWGCDICQEVCPHTKRALQSGTIFSPIPFFHEETVPHLTLKTLSEMSDDVFSARAYAWRKRETISRNLILKEQGDTSCSS